MTTASDLDRLVAPLPVRAPELALPTADDVVAAWGLPHHLAAAVGLMAAASPQTGDRAAARTQAQALRRAWGHLRRARVEVAAGILPSRQPVLAAAMRQLPVPAAAEAMALTYALEVALGAIRAASETIDPAVAARHLDEALAALGSAIEVRDAVGWEGHR